MAEPIDPLILDLLEWIGPSRRAYSEVMEAWRTSCPRLSVWEQASARGFLERHHEPPAAPTVSVTEVGRAFVREHRPPGFAGEEG
ncbi:MAG: hypothetical protein AB7I09_13215 [Planctomycetota bacterium]